MIKQIRLRFNLCPLAVFPVFVVVVVFVVIVMVVVVGAHGILDN